jgi:DNA-3-methyladenine glycosylase I
MATTYCEIARGDPFHGPYHDREYGFPIRRDDRLLERFALEINQAGLSWLTILKKKDAFRRAFDGFDPRACIRRTRAPAPARRRRHRAELNEGGTVIANARR